MYLLSSVLFFLDSCLKDVLWLERGKAYSKSPMLLWTFIIGCYGCFKMNFKFYTLAFKVFVFANDLDYHQNLKLIYQGVTIPGDNCPGITGCILP